MSKSQVLASFAGVVTAAPAAPVVDSKVVSESVAAIAQWFKADTDADLSLHKLMRAIGDAPTFETWETVRKTAISDVYRGKYPKATDDAANVWWGRMIKRLKAYVEEQGFDFTIPSKPKATSEAAVKKAEQRVNPMEGKPESELRSALAEAAKVITAADADAEALKEATKAHEQARRALAKIAKDAESAKVKEAKEVSKGVLARINEKIKSMDVADLAAVEMFLDKNWAQVLRMIPDAEVVARASQLETASAAAGGAVAEAMAKAKRTRKVA